MKNKKRALLVILAATLLLASTVLGTMAWLYDIDDENKQEFVQGTLGIDLVVDMIPNDDAADDYDNELVPNKTYDMNPTVTIDADSEECYVRMWVYITDAADVIRTMGTDLDLDGTNDVFLPHTCVAGWDASVWTTETVAYSTANGITGFTVDGDTIIYEFRYADTVAEAQTATTLENLFDTFTLPYWLNNDDVADLADGMTIQFKAEAIQAQHLTDADGDGDVDADDAWANFATQVATNANDVVGDANPTPNPSINH